MRIAIKQRNLLRDLTKWNEYDFVRKGIMIKKFTRNFDGKYQMSECFQQCPYITEPPYNYQIIDIDVESMDIEFGDFDCVDGAFLLNKDRRHNRMSTVQNKAVLMAERDSIIKWFAGYDIMVADHTRCARLGTTCNHNIMVLDIEATQKQERLRYIKQVLNVLQE